MPQLSRYSDEHVEQLLSELLSVLEKHKAPTDLSLMVLGNMVTNLINTSVAPAQRRRLRTLLPAPCSLRLAKTTRTKKPTPEKQATGMVTHRQRYREKVSQMVSWGHWFALFNILLATLLGSRYLFVADWPTTLAGRIYSYLSIVGHFSFLVFATYLLILFRSRLS